MKHINEYFEVLDSTQDFLKNKFTKETLLPNTFYWVQAGFQKAGRGRMGKTWEAETGKSLLLSLAFTHEQLENPSFLPFLSLLALCEGLDQLWPKFWQKAFVKWPNDILIVDESSQLKKIAGLIVEVRENKKVFIGWGVNLFKTQAHERAFSVEEAIGEALNKESLKALKLMLQKTFEIKLSEYLKSPEVFQKNALRELETKWMKKFWGQTVLLHKKACTAERLCEDGSLELKDQDGKLFILQSASAFEMENYKI